MRPALDRGADVAVGQDHRRPDATRRVGHVGDLDPPGERLRGFAVVDRARGGRHALLEALGETRHPERRAGVQDHDVARGALLAVDDPRAMSALYGGVAARELLGFDLAEPELRRVQMRLAHGAVLHVVDGGQVGGRELIEPVDAAEQDRARAAPGEDLGHQRQHPLVGHARPPVRRAAPGS